MRYDGQDLGTEMALLESLAQDTLNVYEQKILRIPNDYLIREIPISKGEDYQKQKRDQKENLVVFSVQHAQEI